MSTARAASFIPALMLMVSVASAQDAPPQQDMMFGGPPVPPIKEQAAIGSYCIHRNLLYSMGDVICVGGQGLVCTPPAASGTGGRAYWSAVPVNRGDVNWAPPAHCGK